MNDAVAPYRPSSVLQRDTGPIGHAQPARRQSEAADTFYDLSVTTKNEPRIEFLFRILRSLLASGTFTKAGKPVEINGLALKDCSHWLRESTGDPDEIFVVLSRPCNARCEFCYVHGNPSTLAVKFNAQSATRNRQELRTRLAAFGKQKAWFSPTFDTEEILINPNFWEAAQGIRQHSNRKMYIVTNGYILRKKTIERLRQLEPIELSVSLNAVDPATRKSVMGAALSTPAEALDQLDKAGIRYDVSVVAWPTISLDELERTLRFADQFDPHSLSVHLPGYTRTFSPVPLFDRESWWLAIVNRLRALRPTLRNALYFTPRLFEEAKFFDKLGSATIIGTTPGSPAARAGLRFGDRIRQVGDIPIVTRAQCNALLSSLRTNDAPRVVLAVDRDGANQSLVLDARSADAAGYKYRPPIRDMFGVHLIGGSITLASIRRLFQLIENHQARRILVLSSEIAQPLAAAMLEDFSFLAPHACEIEVVPTPSRYFGGNICIGELLVASDFISCAREHLERSSYDLIVIPSPSFRVGGWWRDLCGKPFAEIKRRLPVPVELLISESFE